MTTRASRKNIEQACKTVETVKAASTIRQGMPVKTDGDYIVEATAATDEVYGVAYITEDGAWPAGAGDEVTVILAGQNCIAPVLVGTGDVTRGQFVTPTSDGVTDKTVGGGTAQACIVGMVVESGVVGDLVGCNLATGGPCVSA